ncbi:MAG: hypothetical protein WC966_10095 [Bradymonadales bacterium]
MRLEATFAVVIPAGSLSPSECRQFEQFCVKHCIEVHLPMREDAKGNVIVASGLSLQEAQILRRQISQTGYPVDVISDAANDFSRQSAQVEEPSFDTLVVELNGFRERSGGEDVSSLAAEAWNSLEMERIDLGLEAGRGVDGADWSGEHWMKLNDSSETLSVSAKQLLKEVEKAKNSQEALHPPALPKAPALKAKGEAIASMQPVLPQGNVSPNAGFSTDLAVVDYELNGSEGELLQAELVPVFDEPAKVKTKVELLNLTSADLQATKGETGLQGAKDGGGVLRGILIMIALALSVLIILLVLQLFYDIPFLRELLQNL